jgi:hypothetical protein
MIERRRGGGKEEREKDGRRRERGTHVDDVDLELGRMREIGKHTRKKRTKKKKEEQNETRQGNG